MRVRKHFGDYIIGQVTDDKGLNPRDGRGTEKRDGTAQICLGLNRQNLVTHWTWR